MIAIKKCRFLSLLFLLAMLGLAACNTVEGVGKDVESTGEAIEGAAQGASDG